MPIQCVECGREIPAADVNLDTALAKCTGCNAVFGIMDQIPGAPATHSEASPPREVPLPSRFTMDDFGGTLRIQFRWFTPMVFFLLFFCIFWDGFLVVWYTIAFTTNGPLMMKLFPLLHVAVGVGLSWFVLATFVNRTTISVGDGACVVKHGPLPWPGNRNLMSDDIEQLDVVRKTRVNKGRVTHYYDVEARLRDGSKTKLVSSLSESDQARYIEQQIERFLRIKDQPAPYED